MSREVFDRAAQLHQAGRLEEAERLYRSLLTGKARPVPVLVNLAALLAGRGDASEGRRCLEEAAKLAPALHPVHGNLAELALALGDAEAAELHWSRAIALAPDHVSYRSRRGEALCRLARYEEAIDCLRAALSANPSDAKTLTNLGIALRRHGQTEEAIEVLERAADRAPDLAAAQNALGLALYDAAAFVEAERRFRAALTFSPEVSEIHGNLGNSLRAQGRFDEALAAYEAGLALAPASPELRLNRGVVRLGLGDFAQGWADYEARFEVSEPASLRRAFGRPLWRGVPLGAGSLLLYGEQGPGDVVMFASCLPETLAAVPRIAVQCPPTLVPLLARSFPRITVVSERLADGRPAPAPEDTDSVLPIGSLSLFFRRSEAAFPGVRRYLATDARRVVRWRGRLEALGPGLKVGVSWRGGATVVERHLRGTALEDWLVLLRTPGIVFVNLQYGPRREELDRLAESHGVRVADWPGAVENLDDFAAQIDALDLVVSVANTTIHFAGALGKPTWALVPAVPSWRWMVERSDSPWYPSVELIRQSAGEPWAAVLARVAVRLARCLAA